MSFRLLQARGGSIVELGYSINSSGEHAARCKFTLDASLMQRCGWSEETRLQLLLGEDEDAGTARLLAVPNDGRKLRVIGPQGRAHCSFTWMEDVAEVLPHPGCVCALEIVEADKAGITFTLPVQAEEVEA